jgi:hypothetical protein
VTIGTDRNAAMTSAAENRHTGGLASSVQTTTAPEVAMSTTVSPLERIDSDISIAAIALGVARSSFARCPSSENARVLDRALAAVDRLLDERWAAGRP